jgi:hypothetical protein
LYVYFYSQKIPPNSEKGDQVTNEVIDQSVKHSEQQQPMSEDDNRFEIPTDQSIQSKNANEVIYSDVGVPNNSVNNTELFTAQSNDLDTRLK